MPLRTNLEKRGATYYYRRRVPVDVADAFGRSNVRISLGTKNRAEAEKLCKVKDQEFDKLFENLRGGETANAAVGVSTEQVHSDISPPISPAAFEGQIRFEEDQRRHEAYTAVSSDVDGFLKGGYVTHPRDEYYYHLAQEGDWEQLLSYCFRSELKNRVLDLQKRRSVGDFSAHMELSLGELRLAKKLLDTEIQALRAILKEEHVSNEPSVPPIITAIQPISALPSTAPLLSSAAKDWYSAHKKAWRKKTRLAREAGIGLLIQLVGDKAIDAYTKADARAFRDLLSQLPANWSKLPQLRGLSVGKAAQYAREHGLAPRSATTANDILGVCRACFAWLAQSFDELQSNPFVGIKVYQKKNPRTERDPFSLSELKALFISKPYRSLDGKSALHWAPMIALYSGMRLAEICQLYADDIVQDSECWYFNISATRSDQSVKNNASMRKVPIHRALLETGLPDLVEIRKQQGSDARLFPEVPLCLGG